MEEDRRLRVALGVIAEGESFRHIVEAFEALTDLDFSPAHAVLLGHALAVADLQRAAAVDGEDRWPQIVIRGPNGDEWMERRPPESQDMLDRSELKRIVQFDQWMEPVLAADLMRQLESGACLLFAPVLDEELEREVCRALLKFAADRVQAHDVPTA